jgi:hypothetical protein
VPITEGKKFPKASRKSCGRNLETQGSLDPQGIKNKPQKHSSNNGNEDLVRFGFRKRNLNQA